MFYNEENRHCDIESCLDILKENDFGFVHQVLTFTRDHAEAETSFSARFGTDYLGTLEHLMKYGRIYLNESEYTQCVEKSLDEYHSFLATRVLQGSEKGFWDFHRRALDRLGYSMSKGKVAKRLAGDLFDLLLNPLNTSKRIARKLSSYSILHKGRRASKSVPRSAF
jgi:hypothetical protein